VEKALSERLALTGIPRHVLLSHIAIKLGGEGWYHRPLEEAVDFYLNGAIFG